MLISDNFDLREFVSPGVYGKWKEKAIWFVDPRIVNIAQTLRSELQKPITINDWHVGGHYSQSGLRTAGDSYFKPFSQHSFGRAIDIKVKDLTPQEVMIHIVARTSLYRSLGLGAIEEIRFTPSWLHIDCRNHADPKMILIVRP